MADETERPEDALQRIARQCMAAETENARLRAAIERVRAECDDFGVLNLEQIDAALAEPPKPEQHFVCGECGYHWPVNTFGPPAYNQRHSWLGSDCHGLFTLVPHYPTPCYCDSYGIRRCPAHNPGALAEPVDANEQSDV